MEWHQSTDKRCKSSALEQEILAKLGELGLDVVPQVKRQTWVFDAAVQGTKILIEVNGTYWHGQPHAQARDARKAAWAAREGYTIITIAEDAYTDDPDTVLLQVVEQVERAQDLAAVDRVDSDTPLSSYAFGDWRDAFVAKLAEFGNVRQACIAAGISRANAYKRRESDAEFRLAWEEAEETFCDLLEGVYARRAIEQSDRAVEFLLKAKRRSVYGDQSKVEHSGPDGGPIALTGPALEAAEQRLSEWRKRQMSELSSLPCVPPGPTTSATPTES